MFIQKHQSDINLFSNLCTDVEILASIGEHNKICEDIKQKLSSPAILKAITYTINDILYKDFSIWVFLQILVLLIIVVFIDRILQSSSSGKNSKDKEIVFLNLPQYKSDRRFPAIKEE